MPAGALSYYVKLRLDKGATWQAATKRLEEHKQVLRANNIPPAELVRTGFYISKELNKAHKRSHIVLATQVPKLGSTGIVRYHIMRPYNFDS